MASDAHEGPCETPSVCPDGPIALTGGTGFIGRAFARACRERGLKTACLVRGDSDAAGELASLGAVLVQGDLDDQEALNRLCQGARSVVHCAAFMGKRDPDRSERVNVRGTERLLGAAEAAGVATFLYVSSISVYRGTESNSRVFTERIDPYLHPQLNHYSRTKLLGEHKVVEYCSESSLDYIIIRPTNVYGPGSRPWGGDVERFVSRFRVSFGRVPFDFVHIDDLVDGMISALATPLARNQTINLGHEMVRLHQFHEIIAGQHNVSVLRLPRPIDAAIRYVADLYATLRNEVRSTAYTAQSHYPHKKASALIGYRPRRSLLHEAD